MYVSQEERNRKMKRY